MAKKQARPYHHGDLRTALVAATLELVEEHGPRGFSLTEAARRAGVSAAAPYRHFENKDALLAAIVVEGNQLLAKEMRQAVGKRPLDRAALPDLAAAYVAFASRHRAYFMVIFSAGIDKALFPAVAPSARAALGVAVEAAGNEADAVACWTIAHGVAALALDGALETTQPEVEPEELARTTVAAHFGLSLGRRD